ncbi:hypothetical protein ACIFOT_32485 [Neobacillus sp. NRS-1170]|uniref:hypothetical protein n=1 Tax=Neobacillus sp. NRS-1170 TaxID=3233898 RepID=UPI003D2B4922
MINIYFLLELSCPLAEEEVPVIITFSFLYFWNVSLIIYLKQVLARDEGIQYYKKLFHQPSNHLNLFYLQMLIFYYRHQLNIKMDYQIPLSITGISDNPFVNYRLLK